MAGLQARGEGRTRQAGGEVSAGERIAGAHRLDHVDAVRGDEDLAVGGEDGRPDVAVLNDELGGLGQQRADGRGGRRAPQRLGLVTADEDDVGATRQIPQHGRGDGCRPQRGPVIDIDADGHTRRASTRDETLEERGRRTVRGQPVQRRRDARHVHDRHVVEIRGIRVGQAEVRGCRAVAVVVHAAAGVFHVQAGAMAGVDGVHRPEPADALS